jgi:hypothetical protein
MRCSSTKPNCQQKHTAAAWLLNYWSCRKLLEVAAPGPGGRVLGLTVQEQQQQQAQLGEQQQQLGMLLAASRRAAALGCCLLGP